MLHRIRRASRSTFQSLSVRNYRLYFIGQGISMSGTWMQTIAQTWLVLQLTHSGTAIGLLVATQFLPILLLGPIGGVIADRFPKRGIIYVTQTSALLLALVLAILVQTHTVQLWMIFVLAGLLGCVQLVDNPTRQSFIIELVGPERLPNAVTLNSVQVNLARVIGPTIAGLLISGTGIGVCFFCNAASYIAVLICLALMDARTFNPARRKPGSMGRQLREGLAYVLATPLLRDTLVMLIIIGTFTYEFQVVLPILANRTFHGQAGLYALLTTAMGLGAVLGGIAVAGRQRVGLPKLITAAVFFGVAMLATAVAPTGIVAAIMLIAVGVASIMFSALANSTLQLAASPDMRGRVMSLWTVAFVGTTPIGGPIIGWVSDISSPKAGLAVGGIAALLAAAFGAYMLLRHPASHRAAISAASS